MGILGVDGFTGGVLCNVTHSMNSHVYLTMESGSQCNHKMSCLRNLSQHTSRFLLVATKMKQLHLFMPVSFYYDVTNSTMTSLILV